MSARAFTSGLVLAALVVGCGLQAAPEVRALRQPAPGSPLDPVQIGRNGDAWLGASVAACREPGFVAGAPGDNSTFLFLDGGLWFDLPLFGTFDAGAVGVAVACEGLSPNLVAVSAGFSGVWTHRRSGINAVIQGAPASALARGHTSSTPLLLGTPEQGTVEFQLWSGATYATITGQGPLTAAPEFGAAMAWEPQGTAFVVGDPASDTVRLFWWNATGPSDAGIIIGPSGSRFGAALATGDVHANPGLELVVGAPGANRVFVYSDVLGQAALVMVLEWSNGSGVTGSFGRSLAVEPNPVAGTLHALWVGDPAGDQVIRFVGDAGVPFSSGSGGAFGYSLAAQERNLIVGAPRFSGAAGAVYTVPFDVPPFSNAVAMPCTVGAACVSPGCVVGQCVGGVLCALSGNALCADSECIDGVCSVVDAGQPDAGLPDAGKADGGQSDAGVKVDAGAEVDAGTSGDAGVGGPVRFGTACGCSGAGAVPLLVLAGVLSRRRR